MPSKSTPRLPKVFKKGKWNPDVELEKEEFELEYKDTTIWNCCCLRCSDRNMFRAINNQDYKLLRMCVNEKSKVANINSTWGLHKNITPLVQAILLNDIEAIKEIVRPHSVKQGPNYERDRIQLFTARKEPEQYLLDFINSGEVGNMAYGTNI